MEKELIGLKSTYIVSGIYISKNHAAEWLGISTTSLQGHIKAGRVPVSRCPSGCYMINERDLLEFQQNRRKPGRPTIYPKE